MRTKVEPRYPEENQKLRRAVLSFGNTTRLARESGVGVATIQRIADGESKFPWAQTVRAIETALKRLVAPLVVTTWAPPPQSRQAKSVRPQRKRGHRQTATELRLQRRRRRSDQR